MGTPAGTVVVPPLISHSRIDTTTGSVALAVGATAPPTAARVSAANAPITSFFIPALLGLDLAAVVAAVAAKPLEYRWKSTGLSPVHARLPVLRSVGATARRA